MFNKRQIVVKQTANTCCKDQDARIATQLLLDATKDRRIEKKIQRRIRQLKTNYCCRTSNFSSSITFASNSSSTIFAFDFSSSLSIFSYSSLDLFVSILLTRDLSTKINLNELSIDNSCNRLFVSFLQVLALLRCTIRISTSKKKYKDRIQLSSCMQLSKLTKIE